MRIRVELEEWFFRFGMRLDRCRLSRRDRREADEELDALRVLIGVLPDDRPLIEPPTETETD